MVYAVEFSLRCALKLKEMTSRRKNIVPIIEDARHPWKYRMLVGQWQNITNSIKRITLILTKSSIS